MQFLKSILGKTKKSVVFDAPLAPEQDLFVIGDIHGCLDLLEKLLAKRPADTQLVFVGDLVDRGPDSAGVLAKVQQECENGAICLMGNHERMMLDFLDRPSDRGGRWLRYGGLQTLDSFNIRGVLERASGDELVQARGQLEAAFPKGQERWMRQLPLQYKSGNVHIVHASAAPDLGLDEQASNALLWGHPDFQTTNRDDGQWVVYGHTINPEPLVGNGRIGIDTGAYATGVLTAAHIKTDDVSFVSASY